jgi:hypothetical protein
VRAGDDEARAILEDHPPIPPLAAYLWSWWVDLASTRTSSGFGPNPLTRHDLHAWEADTFHRLNGWERATILKLDALWLASVQQADKETK